MPLTERFHTAIQKRARNDAAYRQSLLREGTDAILNGEFEVGYRLIGDYAGSVTYLDQVGEQIGLEDDAVLTLFDPDTNPGGSQLMAALIIMLHHEGLALSTRRQLGVGRRPLS